MTTTVEPDAVYIQCERRVLAYHEAGHVVSGHVLGYRVSSATLGHSGTLGKYRGSAVVHLPPDAPLACQLFVNAAGPVAEWMFTHYQSRADVLAHAWGLKADLGRREEELKARYGSRAREFVESQLPEVERWLEPRRTQIEAVAQALLEKDSLNEAEIAALLPPPDPASALFSGVRWALGWELGWALSIK